MGYKPPAIYRRSKSCSTPCVSALSECLSIDEGRSTKNARDFSIFDQFQLVSGNPYAQGTAYFINRSIPAFSWRHQFKAIMQSASNPPLSIQREHSVQVCLLTAPRRHFVLCSSTVFLSYRKRIHRRPMIAQDYRDPLALPSQASISSCSATSSIPTVSSPTFFRRAGCHLPLLSCHGSN